MPLTTTSASRAASVVLASAPTSSSGRYAVHAGRVGRAGDRARRGRSCVPRGHRDDGHAQRDGLLGDEVEVGAGGQSRPPRSGRGCAATRSMACVPIEPVEPSRTMRRGARRGVSHPGILAQPPVWRSGGHSSRPEQLLALEGVGDGPGHAEAVHPDVVAPRARAAAVVGGPVGLDLVALGPRRDELGVAVAEEREVLAVDVGDADRRAALRGVAPWRSRPTCRTSTCRGGSVRRGR